MYVTSSYRNNSKVSMTCRDKLVKVASTALDVTVLIVKWKRNYCVKCGKGNHMTNRCWLVCNQLGLPLSDAAKAYFQKQGGSPKKDVNLQQRRNLYNDSRKG